MVTGVGQHQMWAAQFLLFDRSNSFVSSGGLGAMGFELPAALGVQAAKPNIPVWTVAGGRRFPNDLAGTGHTVPRKAAGEDGSPQ